MAEVHVRVIGPRGQAVFPSMDFLYVGGPSSSGTAILIFAACAAACVGWFSAVDGWFEPWWLRLVGRVLGVRIQSVCASVGLLKIRTWATVPAGHPKASAVVLIGAVTTLISALLPGVAMAVLAVQVRPFPIWAAALTLMSVLTCPIGVVARVIGEPRVN
jgi:hypothetical protein